MKKKIMIPAAVCFLAVSICLASLAWGAPREQIFRFNLYTNPISLDPALSYDSTSDEVLNGVFEGLVRTSRNGGIEPAMAKSWAVSQDGRTYTFKLRGDAAWSNKQKVKASDFRICVEKSAESRHLVPPRLYAVLSCGRRDLS
ncbi:ABC transporter substrate-binding protein [Paenibacillus zanthoxyli]|uniref:ABC transporter substrate-binding protein n=1 Tax=Paenibacillus zanthoxyli TaxID=369399 RepID=UPI000A033EE6|nr:ABC transporter substrate-binding protein [Paenibacillus zanthoxyli]